MCTACQMLRMKACSGNSASASDFLTTSLPRRDFNPGTVKLQWGTRLANKTKCLSWGGELLLSRPPLPPTLLSSAAASLTLLDKDAEAEPESRV